MTQFWDGFFIGAGLASVVIALAVAGGLWRGDRR